MVDVVDMVFNYHQHSKIQNLYQLLVILVVLMEQLIMDFLHNQETFGLLVVVAVVVKVILEYLLEEEVDQVAVVKVVVEQVLDLLEQLHLLQLMDKAHNPTPVVVEEELVIMMHRQELVLVVPESS